MTSCYLTLDTQTDTQTLTHRHTHTHQSDLCVVLLASGWHVVYVLLGWRLMSGWDIILVLPWFH